ncbi:MAG: hypothetical protein WA664_17775 [Candidatus Acidiferrales bacterium]
MSYPRDWIKAILIIFVFALVTFIPAAGLIGLWFLTQLFNLGSVTGARTGGAAYAVHVAGAVLVALTARFFEDPEGLPLSFRVHS